MSTVMAVDGADAEGGGGVENVVFVLLLAPVADGALEGALEGSVIWKYRIAFRKLIFLEEKHRNLRKI